MAFAPLYRSAAIVLTVLILAMAAPAACLALDYDVHSKRSRYFEFLGRTLPSNYVTALACDSEEPRSVIIGTVSGLCKYNGKNFRTYGVDPGLYREAPIGERINCILPTRNEIWVGSDSGLSKYNKITGKWTYFEKSKVCPLPTNYIQCLDYVEPLLYVGTWGEGLLVYDTRNSGWKTYSVNAGLGGRYVSSLAYDKNRNVMWVGTYDNGLFAFSEGRFVSYSAKTSELTSDKINCLGFSAGKLYIGTPLGLCIYDGKNFKTYSRGKDSKMSVILALKIDNFNVYIGTDYGLFKLYGGAVTPYPITTDLSAGKPVRVTSIEAVEDRLFIGTQHQGLIEMKR